MIIIKNIKAKSIIVLIITIIVLGYVLKDNFETIIETLKTCNPLWIIIGLITMSFSILFKSLGLESIINGYKYKLNKWKIFIIELKTCFFNGITPFQTGGQPFQLYELHKEGIGYVKGASIELINFVTYQFALVLIGFIVLIISIKLNIFSKLESLSSLLVVGFTINTLIMIFLILFSYAKKFTKKVASVFIKVLSKLRIIKGEKEILNKIDDKLDEFHKVSYFYKEHKKEVLLSVIYHFMGLICLYIIPLFAFYSLNDFNSINLIESITCTAFTIVIGSFVPIPGGSGGMEYVYTKIFGYFASGNITTTTLIIWRSISYYIPMLVGGILFNLKESD